MSVNFLLLIRSLDYYFVNFAIASGYNFHKTNSICTPFWPIMFHWLKFHHKASYRLTAESQVWRCKVCILSMALSIAEIHHWYFWLDFPYLRGLEIWPLTQFPPNFLSTWFFSNRRSRYLRYDCIVCPFPLMSIIMRENVSASQPNQ